ncbi:MAG: hypothetical protein KIT17_24195 [Rubrivivax sp.]|nr:hypothetical protein [Rubrivivax sp.]
MSASQVSVESSLLMWALAALIVWLGAHVLLGWMRQAQEAWEWDLGRFVQVAIGGATFGTALSVSIPLGLAGEALSFPIGYSPLAALGLWLGTMLGVTVLALVPVWREEGASAAGAGVLLGAAITGLQVAWMLAVGFRPGIRWDGVFIAAAAVVSAAGTGTAMAIAFPYGERARTYSYSWRIAAAGLIGLAFLAGYALLLFAADLPTQIGSVFRHELPGSAISLLGGGLLPIVLLLMVMDLETRRRQRRRQWRARRRGDPGASVYGSESVMPGMQMQPPQYQPRYQPRHQPPRDASRPEARDQPGATPGGQGPARGHPEALAGEPPARNPTEPPPTPPLPGPPPRPPAAPQAAAVGAMPAAPGTPDSPPHLAASPSEPEPTTPTPGHPAS